MLFYDIFLNLLGFFIFLFVFWKKLKEDYLPEQVFTVAFYLISLASVFLIISHFFFPSFWFWSIFLSFLLSIFIGKWRFNLRFYEIYEAGLIGLLPWLSFLFLLDAMKTTSWYSFCGFLLMWIFVLIYIFLNIHYKSFSWYKSGKLGFSGLVTTAIFFIVRMLVAIFYPSMLSLSGSFEAIFSGLFSFLSFLLLFILSR